MSVKTVEYRFCDICQKEGAKNYNVLAYRTFSASDASERYIKPRFETVSIDLCDECASKITALHSVGVYGEQYRIEPIIGSDEQNKKEGADK